MGKTREEFAEIYQSRIESGQFRLLDFKVIKPNALDDDAVHFRVVWTVEESGSSSKTETFFTVHRDKDGIWRVNEGRLVDRRPVTSPEISNVAIGLTIDPLVVERYETYMVVAFYAPSPTGHFSFRDGETPWCQFPSGNVAGKFDYGTSTNLIHLDGFFEDYPLSCTFPDLDIESRYDHRWKAPTLVLNYE